MDDLPKKILLVDDHLVVIMGTRMLLQHALPELEFDEAYSGYAALEKIQTAHYDLVIMDINMPNFGAFEFIEKLRSHNSKIGILVFSMNAEEIYAPQYLKFGVDGYVNKEAPAAVLVEATRTILAGKRYLSEDLLVSMIQATGKPLSATDVFQSLTPKEFEVMHYLLNGLSTSAISHAMSLAMSTIATHKSKIFEKTGATNVLELAELAKSVKSTRLLQNP